MVGQSNIPDARSIRQRQVEELFEVVRRLSNRVFVLEQRLAAMKITADTERASHD